MGSTETKEFTYEIDEKIKNTNQEEMRSTLSSFLHASLKIGEILEEIGNISLQLLKVLGKTEIRRALEAMKEQHEEQYSNSLGSSGSFPLTQLKTKLYEDGEIFLFGKWRENKEEPEGECLLAYELKNRVNVKIKTLTKKDIDFIRNSMRIKLLDLNVEIKFERNYSPDGYCETLCAYSNGGDFAFYKYGLGGKIQWKQNKIEEEFTCGRNFFKDICFLKKTLFLYEDTHEHYTIYSKGPDGSSPKVFVDIEKKNNRHECRLGRVLAKMCHGRCLFVMNQGQVTFYKIKEGKLELETETFNNTDGRKNIDFALSKCGIGDLIVILTEDGYLSLMKVEIELESGKVKVEDIFPEKINIKEEEDDGEEENMLIENKFQNIVMCKFNFKVRYLIVHQASNIEGKKLTKFRVYKLEGVREIQKKTTLDLNENLGELTCFNFMKLKKKNFILSMYTKQNLKLHSYLYQEKEEDFVECSLKERKLLPWEEEKKVNSGIINRFVEKDEKLFGMNSKSELLRVEYFFVKN